MSDELQRILNDQLRARVGPSRYRAIQREYARELARRSLEWLGTQEGQERMRASGEKVKRDCARLMEERRVSPAEMDIEYSGGKQS